MYADQAEAKRVNVLFLFSAKINNQVIVHS